jgi:uncharacterized protein
MAEGLPDRVDCAQLADGAAVLERVYPLGDLPRLRNLLADTRGHVRAKFAFANVDSGRAGATVAVEANPHLVCQRCLQGFAYTAVGCSEIEFSSDAGSSAMNSQREVYAMHEGLVSLRELAEEEVLLALPYTVMHPLQCCSRAPSFEAGDEVHGISGDRSRPFAALQDLLKKT